MIKEYGKILFFIILISFLSFSLSAQTQDLVTSSELEKFKGSNIERLHSYLCENDVNIDSCRVSLNKNTDISIINWYLHNNKVITIFLKKELKIKKREDWDKYKSNCVEHRKAKRLVIDEIVLNEIVR